MNVSEKHNHIIYIKTKNDLVIIIDLNQIKCVTYTEKYTEVNFHFYNNTKTMSVYLPSIKSINGSDVDNVSYGDIIKMIDDFFIK